MSSSDPAIDEPVLPIKRHDNPDETVVDRMTDNAVQNIMPARYLRKDVDGNLVEDVSEVFERVAKNIALAEAVYADTDEPITVTPEQIKHTHSRRGEVAGEVFGYDASEFADIDAFPDELETARDHLLEEEVPLTEDNVRYFAYDTVVPELPAEVRTVVEEWKNEFQELMERLAWMPNSPTIMNAGNELQQLSACFVNSPEDDNVDIHETITEASQIFKTGGGVGYDWSKLRPYGDAVGSTGGIASGPLTFMQTADQMCETIAQGGVRRGAQMATMHVTHPDVVDFIHAKRKDVSLARTLKLNDPDDFTHTSFSGALEEARELIDEDGRVPEHLRNAVEGNLSNFNISVTVTDEFLEAKDNGETLTMVNPRTAEPHVATQKTKEMYERYGLGDQVEVGEVLEIDAQLLWERICEGAHENGEPGVIHISEVNRQHAFPADPDAALGSDEYHRKEVITATNPCVTGDTLISTADGLKRAEELYERGVAQDIVVDGRLADEPIKEASSVYQTGEKEVFELTTQEGYRLRLTADHRVLTPSGWTEAADLDDGDTVYIQNRKGGFGTHGDAATGRVLGWLVGDGHLKHEEERAVLSFYGDDLDLIDEMIEDVNAVVRDPTIDRPFEIGAIDHGRSNGGGVISKRIRSTRLFELAADAGLVEEKLQVPEPVLHGSEEMARGFLRALFGADGSVQGSVEKGLSVRLTSVSKPLLEEVQQLLLNFGIASTIYTDRKPAGTAELPGSGGEPETYETQAVHEVAIAKDNLQRFASEIGFLREDKQMDLEQRLTEYNSGPYAERFEATVKTVESDGIEPVYDLTEPDTHSFVANGLVVHNCGEEPLMEYDACNLGHINLSTIVDESSPDWRTFAEESDIDSLAERVEAFLEEAIDWERLNRRVETGTRFLDNVVTMSDFPIPEIDETVGATRKVGLGIMGLAQMYIQLGVQYGSEVGNEMARQVMTHINHESKRVSRDLADERGVFDWWDDSKFADPTAHAEWFERHVGADPAAYEEGYPMRNYNTTTIAPTGTTSMLANTSGGCEPIYDVAFFKNVSDDVQGDEMLVEFDDYFLRTLEANGLDVEAVKEEAVELMNNNEWEGVESLESVPDEIGELFVTTQDLSAIEHASIQCALQHGVDAAISKTVNAPNDATLADTKEAFDYVLRNGGKGVTYYRDGTRSKQVKTTRAQNAEFADEDEAAETIAEQIEATFGSLEAFLDHAEAQSVLEESLEELRSLGEAAEANAAMPEEAVCELNEEGYVEVRSRPDVLHGITQRIDTGYGKLYVNINEDEQGRPFELFANIGNSGGFTASFTESLAKTISTALRSGIDPREIADELQGIRSPKVAWDKGEQIQSIPDAIGTAMRRYLDGEIDKGYPQQRNLTELQEAEAEHQTDGGSSAVQPEQAASEADSEQVLAAGENPECPECGSMALYYSEGCKTCEACGWSEC